LTAALSLVLVLSGCGNSYSTGNERLQSRGDRDVPYGLTPTDNSQSLLNPSLISALNADPDSSLVLHVGDIHSGKQFCTMAYDNSIANDWKALKKPMLYTPGDNEWSDCHKSGEGSGTWNTAAGAIDYVLDSTGAKASYQGGDPAVVARLGACTIFFSQPGKDFTGHGRAARRRIRFRISRRAAFVENVWFRSGVLFVRDQRAAAPTTPTTSWYGAPTWAQRSLGV
jgi:hypothetical protein